MNLDLIAHLNKTYDVDFYDDMLFQKQCHLHFYFDLSETCLTFYIIKGNPTLIGLPHKNILTVDDVIPFIKLDNELAEVEGKDSFLEDMIIKIKEMKDEVFIYLPLIKADETIWLHVAIQAVKGHPHLKYAQILRVLNRTPNAIIHYKKTHQDPLTRLFTRETLQKHLDNLTEYDNRYGIYFDIDNFKAVNDAFGHEKGDQLLIDIANHFISKWERNVIYYRLGGDEFFIYVYDHTKDEVMARAKQLIYDIENLNEMTKKVDVSASIGIVELTEKHHDYHELLDLGDQSMYLSKRKGKGHITFHEHKD